MGITEGSFTIFVGLMIGQVTSVKFIISATILRHLLIQHSVKIWLAVLQLTLTQLTEASWQFILEKNEKPTLHITCLNWAVTVVVVNPVCTHIDWDFMCKTRSLVSEWRQMPDINKVLTSAIHQMHSYKSGAPCWNKTLHYRRLSGVSPDSSTEK